jgi:predicted PurR-regulated permease PerM
MDVKNPSPKWDSPTKAVVGITMVGIVAGLLIKFQAIVTPIILSIILVYLLYPAANFLRRRAHLPWGLAVLVVYLVLFIAFMGALTVLGLEMVTQVESVIVVVEHSLDGLPFLARSLASAPWNFGPFHVDLALLDLESLSAQFIDALRPMLGRTGALLSTLASGAANTLGWSLFVMLISYFILADSGGLRDQIIKVDVPGYQGDFERMGGELVRIWNAFLRGQLVLIGLATLIYLVLLNLLGLRYALGLALMAGSARFIPYAGPFLSWTVLALVAFFQPDKPLGMTPLVYMIVILACASTIDGILDNYVLPRVMADALKVHPAAVMVAAIIALELLGVVGVVISAPILATLQLMGRYVVRKMFDLDPWAGLEEHPAPPRLRQQIADKFNLLRTKLKIG